MYDPSLQFVPRQPSEAAREQCERRRRIEDIEEARRLRRECSYALG